MDRFTSNDELFADFSEPAGAFPYKAPSADLVSEFSRYRNLEIPSRPIKRLMDVVLAGTALPLIGVLLLVLKVLYVAEGIFDRRSKGPLLYYYWCISGGRKIKKYKVRQFCMGALDEKLAESHDWRAYAHEWDNGQLTRVGRLAKKYYLDELPQFWSIFIGQISFVGPRPLAVHHHFRDLDQGNFYREKLKGGLLGFGHIRKGTSEFGMPVFEFEYLRAIIHFSHVDLFMFDLKIILRGGSVVIDGGGH